MYRPALAIIQRMLICAGAEARFMARNGIAQRVFHFPSTTDRDAHGCKSFVPQNRNRNLKYDLVGGRNRLSVGETVWS